jgi:SRSO17 transposase
MPPWPAASWPSGSARPAGILPGKPTGACRPAGCWLLAEWPPEAGEPSGYWLSTLPEDAPVSELVRLAKIRWRTGHDYRELKTGLGLDHFEGRSYLGWHRHVTLAVLAQAFITMIRADPKVPAPG